jgi:hypothetical protein
MYLDDFDAQAIARHITADITSSIGVRAWHLACTGLRNKMSS